MEASAVSVGVDRLGTRHGSSPATLSGSRLVANTCTEGQARATASASSAQAGRRCSVVEDQHCLTVR